MCEQKEEEERKKEERRWTKSKFSCLFFSAFVWASRTLKAFFTIEQQRFFHCKHFVWLCCGYYKVAPITLSTGGHFETAPFLHWKVLPHLSILEIHTKWHVERRPWCVFGAIAHQPWLAQSSKPKKALLQKQSIHLICGKLIYLLQFFSYAWAKGRKKERKKKKEDEQNQNFHVCFSQLLYGLAELLGHFLYNYNRTAKTFSL